MYYHCQMMTRIWFFWLRYILLLWCFMLCQQPTTSQPSTTPVSWIKSNSAHAQKFISNKSKQQREIPHEHSVHPSICTQISQFKFLSNYDDKSNLQERSKKINETNNHSIFGFLVLIEKQNTIFCNFWIF